jgi:hypothetical protein
VPEFVAFSAPGITEFSFSFDQNMRLAIAFVQDGVAKLRWFDSVPGQTVITEYPSAITPRVVLDDKRFTQTSASDIIFAYMRNGDLYYRQQRDRFQTEIDPTELMPEPERTQTRERNALSPGLIKIGFNRQLRLQFLMEVPR